MIRRILFTLLAAVTVVALARPVTVGAATPPGRVLILGDSLTWESRVQIADQMATRHRSWAVSVVAFGGTAPCDWLPWLKASIATFHPTEVAFLTAGNQGPTACSSQPMGSEAYIAQYRADIEALYATATASGARVVFFMPPPFYDPVRDAAARLVAGWATNLAYQYPGVSIANQVRSAFGSNKFVSVKPCLTTETAVMGCDPITHTIPIRTIWPHLDMGLHLCPSGLFGLPVNGVCPSYSSGEYRFARAIAAGVANPPAPKLAA
jgi:hypothetical protein